MNMIEHHRNCGLDTGTLTSYDEELHSPIPPTVAVALIERLAGSVAGHLQPRAGDAAAPLEIVSYNRSSIA